MQTITRFVEGRLQLVVNRQQSRAARLSEGAFLGFQILRGRIVWTDKARQRFKERIGYWFMAGTSIVQRALDNRWLSERGVPSLKEQWVQPHYGERHAPRAAAAANLTGIPTCREPAGPVVWEPGGQSSRRPDWL